MEYPSSGICNFCKVIINCDVLPPSSQTRSRPTLLFYVFLFGFARLLVLGYARVRVIVTAEWAAHHKIRLAPVINTSPYMCLTRTLTVPTTLHWLLLHQLTTKLRVFGRISLVLIKAACLVIKLDHFSSNFTCFA
jgi:hypothetical protein